MGRDAAFEGGAAMGDRRGHSGAAKSERARRYAIPLPVRYRPNGYESWYEGRIENISESGLLFEADRAIAIDTPVEIRFVLPATMPDEQPAELVCRGKIVRTVPTSEKRSIPALAATIASYHFRRPGFSQDGSKHRSNETL